MERKLLNTYIEAPLAYFRTTAPTPGGNEKAISEIMNTPLYVRMMLDDDDEEEDDDDGNDETRTSRSN